MRTRNTSNSEHWNKCELHTYLRKVIKHKWGHSFPPHLVQFKVMVSRASPAAQGTRRDPPGQTPFRRRATHSLPQTGTMETRQCTSCAYLWDGGGNQFSQKTPTDMGEWENTDSGPSRSRLIHFITKPCWTKRHSSPCCISVDSNPSSASPWLLIP